MAKTYLCENPACSLGTVGNPGRFSGGITKEQVHVLTGQPADGLKSGEDYGAGLLPELRTQRNGGVMAQMCPDEGLDLWLGQFPLTTAKYTSPLNLALFTSQTASTVITHAQTLANITETTYTSYARQCSGRGDLGRSRGTADEPRDGRPRTRRSRSPPSARRERRSTASTSRTTATPFCSLGRRTSMT